MQRVNVRAIAEFYYESGDLGGYIESIERMREGMQAHTLRQGTYPASFRREVPVSLKCDIYGTELMVYGRMDGFDEKAQPPLVEEIKTTRLTPTDIREDDYPVHWAQAEIYAYMVSKIYGAKQVDIRLVYTTLSGENHHFLRRKTDKELQERFFELVMPYVQWLRLLEEKRQRVVPSIKALQFPYGGYREGQREMAVQSYYAFKHRATLLCQAPTGIGKTMGALFPAIKAIGEGLASRVFYLTARGTAAQAAEDALERLRANGLTLHSVRITAKEKACVMPGGRCDPTLCPRAVGYYDRRREALREAVLCEKLTKEEIAFLADKYELCPFELSLDLAESCDVIICDYNYAFDPKVKLKRFFTDKTDSLLLVDEAHNLIDRAREMLSAKLATKDLVRLKKEIAALGEEAKRSSVYETLCTLIKTMKGLHIDPMEPQCDLEPPYIVSDAALAFTEKAGELLSQAGVSELFRDVYFQCLDFVRTADDYTEKHRTLLEANEKGGVSIRLWCYDPSEHLKKCLKKTRGAVLFSATLSPMDYYAAMLGVDKEKDDALLDLPSPFPPENLAVLRMPVSTRYKEREKSAPQIANAVVTMCKAHPGNYIVCLPSYKYLQLLELYLRAQAGNIRIISQQSGMTEEQRTRFLDMFRLNTGEGMIALIVMGGIFAEGIDLPGELLSGAAIVGVGMPQPSFEREALRELTDDGCGSGTCYAYVYPGLERVLQAAGRVIRTEDDAGVVLLLDDRYYMENYEELLPPHWQVRSVKTAEGLEKRLAAFWRINARREDP